MTMKKGDEGEIHSENTLKSAADLALERAAEAKADDSPEQAQLSSILQKELDELREQAAKGKDHWDRLLRAQADLENYRKRVARERQDLIKTANEKLLSELLAPLDHFEMGLQSVQKNDKDPLRQGMEMVLAQFKQFLKSQGVTEIDAVGQKFDPALHEAVAEQESDSPEGQVIQQLRKGYRLQDKLLRPASVIVSKGKSTAEKKTEEPTSVTSQ
jgi:molecular chaperone GrpE